MNKSLLTNVISAVVFIVSYFSPEFIGQKAFVKASIFAFSGAITNWLAIHMLFEKIPGLYGSGIISLRFEQFKEAIRSLIMENFFSEGNFSTVTQNALPDKIQPELVIDKIDFNKVFDGFVTVISNSSYGSMLSLLGGKKALDPIKEPMKNEMKRQVSDIVSNIDIASIMPKGADFSSFRSKINAMVNTRLNDLTPKHVKMIIEDMIRKHLGWLVVWGGIFGALIGFVCALFV